MQTSNRFDHLLSSLVPASTTPHGEVSCDLSSNASVPGCRVVQALLDSTINLENMSFNINLGTSPQQTKHCRTVILAIFGTFMVH